MQKHASPKRGGEILAPYGKFLRPTVCSYPRYIQHMIVRVDATEKLIERSSLCAREVASMNDVSSSTSSIRSFLIARVERIQRLGTIFS